MPDEMSRPAPSEYTFGHDSSSLEAHTQRSAQNECAYLLPYIRPNYRILDLGCGPGSITLDYAALVPQGSVIGVDFKTEAVEVAKQTAKQRGILNVEFVAGDAMDLGDLGGKVGEGFDVVCTHQCLVHLKDPVKAMKEMRRVCKVGGVVAAREGDMDTVAIHPESCLTKCYQVLAALVRSGGGEANAGRFLVQWALEAGFRRSSITVHGSLQIFASDMERDFLGNSYAERWEKSGWRDVIQKGLATEEDVDLWAKSWRDWAKDETGYFSISEGEIVCRKEDKY